MLSAKAVIFSIAFCFSGAIAQNTERELNRKQLAALLSQIVRASRYGFDTLFGARVERFPGRQSWYEAKTYLPGASYCRIDEEPDLAYRCVWERTASRGDLQRFQAELAADVEAALGSEWKRQA